MELLATYDLTETNEGRYKKVSHQNYVQTDQIEVQEGENLKAIKVLSNSKTFLIEPSKVKTKNPTKLLIDRSNGRISQLDLNEKPQIEFVQTTFCSAFLGIMNILDKGFLLMVEEVHKVGKIDDANIYQIAKISFISFENETDLNASPKSKEITNYKALLDSVFSVGFYFSYNYDLTTSRVKQAQHLPTDTEFLWNEYLFKDILSQGVDRRWMIQLIQGFFGTYKCKINGLDLDFFLITRRSNKRAGTRYNSRGVDDDGNVANFCETEQLIFYNKYCCSHLQIRGSVPVFWQQRGITAQTKLTRNFELTNPAFVKHFLDIVAKKYLRVLCVNLMARSKPQEQMITDAYEEHVKKTNLPDIRYEYFDFHHACKGQKFEMVNPLVKKLQLVIENFRFFAEDTRNNSILMKQKGIVRTNCLDCLDRTNFFMTKVAALIFGCQMKHLGVDLSQEFGEDILTHMDNNNIKENHIFIQNFKNIWADNGDYISKFYTGTGSTHTNITRSGKRDIFGLIDHGMKSLGRFYKQNFEDNYKQQAIDMILGQHTETVNIFAESLDKELKTREREFATYEDFSIFIATWYMNGFEPPSSFELTTEMLDIEDNPNPDCVIINLQSIIYNSSVSNSEKISEDWASLILSNLSRLNDSENYILLNKKEYCGCLTLIFAVEKLKTRITKFSYENIKFGILGNRGAVIMKFFIDDSSFCIINCQLDEGAANSKYRVNDLNEIHAKSFQIESVGKKKEEKIEMMDYKFLTGTLNFSICTSDAEIRKNIENYEIALRNNHIQRSEEILEKLFSLDEFSQIKNLSDYLAKYQEAKINFLPTANYEAFSTVYQNDKAPNWSDRILISANEGCIIKQYLYSRKEYLDSTHRPVIGYFLAEVKKIDKAKKEEITKQIYEEQKAIIEEANKEDENLKTI